jgi:hypothetical protein
MLYGGNLFFVGVIKYAIFSMFPDRNSLFPGGEDLEDRHYLRK